MLLGASAAAMVLGTAHSEQVVIYHTNDTHGYLAGDGSSIIGIDQVAGLKESTPDAILVDAGDATQGMPMASLTKGADVIELMNLAGYDLMTAGNHEFDFGTEQFLSNVALADFPVLAANIYQDGTPLLDGMQEGSDGCHTVMERDGVRIGFFGLTTVQTATATNPTGIAGLEFRDEIETAKKEIDELEQEDVDVIVAVCHLGDGDAPCTSIALADAMTGEYQDKLDVIIDGHSHTVENREQNGILIAQTGSGMTGVGKLTLTVSADEVEATEELLTAADMANVPTKAAVTQKLQQIEASQAELLEESIGQTNTTLWAGWIGDIATTRFVETNFGDLVADAFWDAATSFLQQNGTPEEKTMPVIAVENGGGIREAVPNGEITKGDLIAAFPFSNTLYMKKITPQILYQMMEVSGSLLDGQDPETGMLLQQQISGGFLQIAGFQVVFDPDGAEGEKVVRITLAGQSKPLDRNDTTTQLILVSNNYIMSGGNDYTMLADLPKYGEAGGELETIQNYIARCLEDGVLVDYAGLQNRIMMTGGQYQPKDYMAAILVTDEKGNPLPNQALSYRVDGGQRMNANTDGNGFLRITVTDGSHGVRLSDAQAEVYVDNYAGLGMREDALRQWPELTFLTDGSCDPV
ncbi:MAG TPA: 5'-nucleotidase C-terminal domain-containing protein [Firmicutes bacterium]|nr:5'-nucleotidase C-terminal domain-containing protein [Bacillota bacterium]